MHLCRIALIWAAARGLSLVALAAVATPAAAAKPAAAVSIGAEHGEASSTVAVSFAADAADVHLEARGAHGLSLVGEPVTVALGAVAAGETRRLLAVYTSPSPSGTLVITVSGRFGGVLQGRIASFRVGERALRRPGSGSPRYIELPAERR